MSDKILNLFPTNSTSCMTRFRQSCEQCQKTQSSSKSDSILITDKVSLGCNMQLLRWFLTIFIIEHDRSPVQFVSIMVKYMNNAILMFGNVVSRLSTLIRLYASDIVGCGTLL